MLRTVFIFMEIIIRFFYRSFPLGAWVPGVHWKCSLHHTDPSLSQNGPGSRLPPLLVTSGAQLEEGMGWASPVISSASTGCKVKAGESRIWDGQIIPCAADQCEPLSSCTPYLSSSRKTSLLAHMLLTTSIYQGVRAAMLHSLWAAGRGQTQQEVFVWKDAWLRQRWRDG